MVPSLAINRTLDKVEISPRDITSIYREGGKRAGSYPKSFVRISALVETSPNTVFKSTIVYTYEMLDKEYDQLAQYLEDTKQSRKIKTREIITEDKREIKIINITDGMEV